MPRKKNLQSTKVEHLESGDPELKPGKVDACLMDLIKVFNKHNLSIKELVVAYGNLGYTLGASIGGYQGKGPSIEELNKLYYASPSLAVSIMLQSMLMTTWIEDLDKPLTSKKEDPH